jgi:hypothetical protein
VFSSEEESHEFLKTSVKQQVDFYQSVSNELLNGFIKPNIMYVGFYGWKCNEFLLKLSEKAKKLLNPQSQSSVFVLWNRHFIQGSLELLSNRLYSKMELLTEGYVSQNFKISTMMYKSTYQIEKPMLPNNSKFQSNKDIGSRSVENLNESIFTYMDSLINFITFLGSPVQSVNDYTTNLYYTLSNSIKIFTEKLQSFHQNLIKNTHYKHPKLFSEEYYQSERNSAEFIATVEKIISLSYDPMKQSNGKL